jgi:hypothetical protein
MRGKYEAYILVKVKDGREFVCALNRKKRVPEQDQNQLFLPKERSYPEMEVIWH